MAATWKRLHRDVVRVIDRHACRGGHASPRRQDRRRRGPAGCRVRLLSTCPCAARIQVADAPRRSWCPRRTGDDARSSCARRARKLRAPEPDPRGCGAHATSRGHALPRPATGPATASRVATSHVHRCNPFAGRHRARASRRGGEPARTRTHHPAAPRMGRPDRWPGHDRAPVTRWPAARQLAPAGPPGVQLVPGRPATVAGEGRPVARQARRRSRHRRGGRRHPARGAGQAGSRRCPQPSRPVIRGAGAPRQGFSLLRIGLFHDSPG